MIFAADSLLSRAFFLFYFILFSCSGSRCRSSSSFFLFLFCCCASHCSAANVLVQNSYAYAYTVYQFWETIISSSFHNKHYNTESVSDLIHIVRQCVHTVHFQNFHLYIFWISSLFKNSRQWVHSIFIQNV